ncbi:arabinofuranosyltransferase [Blastococcus sp. URHD0036]|uniref:arabinofuranosyltransferase n=1 Tax=Blastococcus sp. URHD0036 TaxID=1380356 RepID=UPI000495D0DC|nr:arabinofuranosyltransferase [Blastococcus sp. URHD0036]
MAQDLRTRGVGSPPVGAGGTGPEPVGPGRGLSAGSVAGLAVLALAVSLAVQWAITAVDLPADTYVPAAVTTWTLVVACAGLAAVVLSRRMPSWLRAGLIVALLTATATSVLAWPLHGTSYYFGGLWADQQFRTQYLTRMTDSPALADMNYADLPSFYPAAWFWVAGRIADLTGTPGWAAFKPVALTTVGTTPALVWVVWSRLVGWRTAIGVAVVTLVTSVSLSATEPYSWPVAALLPAVAVVFWRQVTFAAPRRAALVCVGLFLGAAAATYSLFGLAGAALVTVLAGVAVAGAREDRRGALRRAVGCLVVAAVPAVLLALVVWAPFLVTSLSSGNRDNVAARFLPDISAELPAVLGADPWHLLLGVGLLALLARLVTPWGRRPDVLLALLVTAAVTYGWYAANTLALPFGTTLLAFRFQNLLVLVLATAGVLALAELLPRARSVLSGRSWQPRRLAVAAVLLAALALTQVVDARVHDLDDRIDRAYATPYPSGRNARGEVDPDREEGWNDALATSIDDLTGLAEDRAIVLSTDYTLLSVHAYRGFQSMIPHYANPLADYEARADYIHRLAASSTQSELLGLLDDCPWKAPDALVLRREDDGLHLRLGSDAFPAAPNTAFADVVFDPDLFTSPAFRTEDVGPFVVAVRAD